VTPPGKQGYLRLAGLALVFLAIAGLLLLLLPSPHKPIHYLVAGTVATAALLVVVFAILWRGKPLP
jgi:hypothetical protein